MSEIIKGSVPGTRIIIDGNVEIDNRIAGKSLCSVQEEEPADEEDTYETHSKKQAEEQEAKELEALREHYRKETEDYVRRLKNKAEQELAKAADEADRIRAQAQLEAKKQLEQLELEKKEALEKAKSEGYDSGYGDGLKKGSEEGYVQGLKKCKETLLDLKSICEQTEKEKAQLMAENRRGIFDLAMSVAEKITMTVFRQKDKNVLEKMVADAAKEFRHAKTVKVTLSKLDLSEDMNADLRILEKCFSPSAQVEFEVLDDAKSGTLLLESSSEILDAGVSAQLKMIGELGRGKFRDKETETTEKPGAQEKAGEGGKPKRAAKSVRSKNAEQTEDAEEVSTETQEEAQEE